MAACTVASLYKLTVLQLSYYVNGLLIGTDQSRSIIWTSMFHVTWISANHFLIVLPSTKIL